MNPVESRIGIEPDLARILRPVHEQVRQVQRRLQEGLGVQAVLLKEVVEHLFAGQGKYLRTAVVLLTARVGTHCREQASEDVALAVELVHNATLIHDDIIDAATLRRNQPSINAKWGNEVSVLSGDFLYARAFHILAALREPVLLQIMAKTGEEMSIGELAEVQHRCNWQLTEAEYFNIIHGKTAILMSAAAELGASLSGASLEMVTAMAAYGKYVGMAFQIADDCLDLVGDARVLGKATGSDLLRGNLSLPLVYLRERLTNTEFTQTFGAVDMQRSETCEHLHMLAQWADERGMIEMAYQRALDYAEDAKQALHMIQGTEIGTSLRHLAEYAVRRRH